ncbi:MAG: carboxypeptidase regulatory-like domain-containing protein, partial [Proteobacteria bacterium]|nr:carboxypeptidase regulatory-like domain-containing protein [Pseudomonadota bacterium]
FSNGAMLSGVSINGGALGTSVSDENGKFIFQNIEESTNYNLVISKDGYTFEANGLSGIIDSEKEIEIKAYKLHSISGKILYKGSALSGVAVEIPNIGTTVSGTDGSFKFENIRFGSNYQIRLHKDKFKFDLLEGTGIVDRDINLTINSTKLVNISGKIIHKGKPVEGVEIECVNIGKTKSNEDGSYTIENVPEGQEYTLKASKVGFVFKPSKAIN